MKSPNTKSSSELQGEVKRELKTLNHDLDATSGRFTPGQFIDDAIFNNKDRNIGSTFDHLKKNPIGTAFLSLGAILLMEDENHQTLETISKNKVTSIKDSIQSVKETVKNQMPHKELSPDTSLSAGDIAKKKVSGLKESFTSKVAIVKSKLHDTALTKAKLTDSLSNVDPMTYMALGIGLGALTGAGLPVTEKERTFVDEKLSPKLGDLNSDLQNALNESSNILKDLVISDVKKFNVHIFKT